MSRTNRLLTMILFGSLVTASLAHAATSGTSNVTLAAQSNAVITITDATIILNPTGTDYLNDYVEAAGAAGLRVNVKSNSSTGMILKLKCADASPRIALSDLLIRTQTAPGVGGTTIGTYTAITAVDQNLWTTTVANNTFTTVTTDIKVQNLFTYTYAGSAGTTNYTNTLTYTVVVQ